MKKYKVCYIDQYGKDCQDVMTEDQILEEYLVYWIKKHRDINRPLPTAIPRHLIECCIDDWIVVNWAQEVKDDKLQTKTKAV